MAQNSPDEREVTEREMIRRLADGENPYEIDPEYGCTNPLTGYFPHAEIAAELARRSDNTRPEFEYDKPMARRPDPDQDILARAHRLRLQRETPMQTFQRQRWETTMGAVRVALDTWREIYPTENTSLHGARVARRLEQAYVALDDLSRVMLGALLDMAQRGELSEGEMATAEDNGNDEA